ncbi:MAG: LysR family transcriptional regulator [Sterolibacterium sp.]|nr:LysR family transcriptional regulator [Sterolibacterium sp.]
MRRKIPNTWALMAFEAAALHESFTKASLELAISQSAICRQIAGLEAFLGVKLFLRSKRGVTLTEAGRSYSRQVSLRLDAIERDTLQLMARRGLGGTLELATVPTFATRWLLPRLSTFTQAYPDITINLSPSTRPFLFSESSFDAAIYFGEASWPGTEARTLMREELVPACSPRLIAPRKKLRPEEIRQYPLLQQTTRPYAWRQWFDSLGLKFEGDMTGARYELFSMMSQAAIYEMGIALIPRFLIEDELKSGLLTVPVKHAFVSDKSYYFIYPEHKAETAWLQHFRDWLEDAAATYRKQVGLG